MGWICCFSQAYQWSLQSPMACPPENAISYTHFNIINCSQSLCQCAHVHYIADDCCTCATGAGDAAQFTVFSM